MGDTIRLWNTLQQNLHSKQLFTVGPSRSDAWRGWEHQRTRKLITSQEHLITLGHQAADQVPVPQTTKKASLPSVPSLLRTSRYSHPEHFECRVCAEDQHPPRWHVTSMRKLRSCCLSTSPTCKMYKIPVICTLSGPFPHRSPCYVEWSQTEG